MEWPNKWIDFWGRLFLSAFLHTVEWRRFCNLILMFVVYVVIQL